MSNIWTIAIKEYKSFFHSAIAYVIGVVVFLSLGIYFWVLLSYSIKPRRMCLKCKCCWIGSYSHCFLSACLF